MKGSSAFTEIREKLRNKIRRDERETQMSEKRVEFIARFSSEEKGSEVEQYQRLVVGSQYSNDQKKVALQWLEKHLPGLKQWGVTDEMFSKLLEMVKNRTLMPETISFLFKYVYNQTLPPPQLQTFYHNIPTLISAIDISNPQLFGDIISILGNVTIDDSRIKHYLITSGYFKIVEEGIASNIRNLDFVQIVLWQMSNLFRRTRTDHIVFNPPSQFLEYLVGFIHKLFYMLPHPNGDEQLTETIRQCFVALEHILMNVTTLSKDFQAFIMSLIEFVRNAIESAISTKIVKEVLNVLKLVCSIDVKCFYQQINLLMLRMIEISVSSKNCLELNNEILDLATTLNSPEVNILLVKSLKSFKQAFQSHRHKLKWSSYLMDLIISICNIQQPRNDLEATCKSQLEVLLEKINLLLLDEDAEIVYHGVKIVYHLTSSVDQPKSLEGMLIESGILQSLKELSLHANKDIYETVTNIFQLLKMVEQY